MAYKGKVLENPLTGQDIRFLKTAKDTQGKFLEMESVYPTISVEPTEHYHPAQEEDFSVISGELTVKMNGSIAVYKAGDHFYIPKGVAHAMWNASSEKTVINWQVRPALSTEYFLENANGLVREGKTNTKGMPDLLQVALIANKYKSVFRLANPPYAVQRILFSVLAPFAYLAGKKAEYKKYID
jgi:mannose-6-phosphate isomerase-like protein (cupin superfamily)